MTKDQAELLRRGEVADFPYVFTRGGSLHMAGREQWERTVPTLLPEDVTVLSAQCEAHLAQQQRQMAFADAEEIRDADRAAARTPDPAVAEEERAEAAERYARHVAARPERMESLARRQVELLEQLLAKAGK